MPVFSYKGRDAHGVLVEGIQDAANSSSLLSVLQSKQITPVDIQEVSGKGEKGEMAFSLFEEKITSLDVMLFSRQMYTMFKAGIPILQALTAVHDSTKNKRFARIIRKLKQALDSGRELSSAMTEQPKIFDKFYVSMVQVGEATGLLDGIFLRLFHHIEFERFMQGQIKAALRYPSFVLMAMAVAIAVINVFVIPSFTQVFESMNAELPTLTKVLIAFSDFTLEYWPLLIVVMVGMYVFFKSYLKTESGRLQWDALKLRIPIAGKIIHKGTMARFARSFALASKSGVPIVSALKLVAGTVDNQYIASKVGGMRSGIERGESILYSARNTDVFNPLVLQMIAVGEESGSLDDLMQEIADMYQRDMEYEIKTLGAQIEPILIVFLGIMVLILALGIFLPVWDLGSIAFKK